MPKQKIPTPQEIYWARKHAQEAYLPPGLINHGNTCFMNSVLQGLIATRLLVDLVQFNDISRETQEHSNTLLLPRRSPQLTNGHGIGGVYEKEWVDMPIGDRFIEIVYRAWRIQSGRKRESLSPKDLLAAVGRKYDQYLDFAQQDAHEFLRILLDAMRMEEQDIIKQRQPPPPKLPKKRRRSSQLSPSSMAKSPANHSTQSPSIPDITQPSSQPLPEADTLISFSDMIFGGKLTSILVCQKCKHISQTYEDFNDISLSLKPEDYAVIHSRKRGRFKKFAKKLTAFPGTSLVVASATSTANSNAQSNANGDAISYSGTKDESNEVETLSDGLNASDGPNNRMGVALSIQRSSSVPPSPREREDPQISEKLLPHLVSRRRSMEHLHSDPPINGELGPISGLDQRSGSPTSDDPASSANRISNSSSIPANEVPDVSDPEYARISPSEAKETESDDSKVIINSTAAPSLPPRVEFSAEEKPVRDHEKGKLSNGKEKKKRDDDNWTKISRRISLTVKLGLRDKDKDKDREKDKEKKGKGKGKDKEKDKDRAKEKDAEINKDRKRSTERRFSAMSVKLKPSSPITSIPDTLSNSSDDRPTHETNNPSPSLAPSTTIVSSASSPIILSLPPSIAIPNESSQSRSQPPIAAPIPLRSFSSQSQSIPRLNTPLQSIQSHMQNINNHVQAQVQKVSGIQRSRSPKLPKQTKEEQEYLRKILADVAPVPVSSRTMSGSNDSGEKGTGAGVGTDVEKSGGTNPLTRLKTSTHLYLPGSNNRSQSQDDHSTSSSTNTSIGTWLPLAAVSQFSGLEECLRMFTAVEVLDGENMVGCRRCWKMQNGYVKGMKDVEDSDDEDDEEREPESESKTEAKEKLLAPPLKSLDSGSSKSSTTSSATFASAESGGVDVKTIDQTKALFSLGITASPSQSPVPLSMSTPTLVPTGTTFTPGTIASITTPRLPHRSNSTPVVDRRSDVKTPKTPSAYPAPPAVPPKDKLYDYSITVVTSPISPQLPESASNTPGGLPIPRISTTPANEIVRNGSTSGAGVEDVFIDTNGDHGVGVVDQDDEAGNNSGIRTPASTSSQSSTIYDLNTEGSTTGTDDEMKKVRRRQGIVFRDSLVVPARLPGRPRPRRTQTMSTDRDGSDGESADSRTSLSRSATPTEESDSEEESAEESASDIGGKIQRTRPFVPPGLGHGESSLVPSVTTVPSLDSATGTTPSTVPLTQAPTLKTPVKVKKKKERILRPAYKRYLISIPPPVLVIHLKRFQQLNPSNSSPLSSFAEKLVSGFSVNQNSSSSNSSRSRSHGHNGGGVFGGFGGIGGGGFKKLEEFVSFPEWLDLGPFLEPKKEEDSTSPSSPSPLKSNKTSRQNGRRDKDGRCMYRLYAVVVHIGNMLGGHYVSYVALPDEPPLMDGSAHEPNGTNTNVGGEKTSHRLVEKGGGGGGEEELGTTTTDSNEKQQQHTASSSSIGKKKIVKRQWAYISDTNVRLVSLDEVLNARAYICMYERV